MDNLEENIKTENKESIATPVGVAIVKTRTIFIGLVLAFAFLFYIFFLHSPNRDRDVIIHISPKDSVGQISDKLKEKDVISSGFAFKSVLRVFSSDKHIVSGDYLFKKGESPVRVISQIILGKHGIEKVRVTLKEGVTNEEIADILSQKIASFNKEEFMKDERVKEGYLFPDTYFFYPMTTASEVVDELTGNFNKKISSLDEEIKRSGKNLSDIIVMASILEKEAKGERDAYAISGILWKRIKIGMALQVDAAPVTYDEAGLPKSPICNPGLVSIKAAISPESSPYLFYLHDDNGQVHFALDFSEHRSNIAHYLK